MSNPDKSIDPRILEAARKEFLRCGYEKASTNVICKNAGVTWGALAKRYAGKDALFCALVADIAEEFKGVLLGRNNKFHASSVKEQEESALKERSEGEVFIEYIYSNFEEFKLLISCSQGSSYGHYMEELADIVTSSTIRFMKETNHEAIINGQKVSDNTIHILVSSYMYGLFEPVVHGMSREEAVVYTSHLKYFFDVGWANIMRLKEGVAK